MKRVGCLLLTISMLILLVSCGDQTADKYCTNCGSGMAKSDSFCPKCGKAVGSNDQSSSIDHKHTYSQYICTGCGEIDKGNAYKYLVEYVKSNGTPNGTYVSITLKVVSDRKLELKYDAQNDTLWASCSSHSASSTSVIELMLAIGYYKQEYTYLSTGVGTQVTGVIDPKTFNENSTMTDASYTGPDNTKTLSLNLAKYGLVEIIATMEEYFDTHDVGLNIHALGYMGIALK